ncbi:hypothetical protein [Paenibacillus montanisoli]|uniref:Uncharacterized protein n=1 Tax=Paenibacillus montanisoli TaxID=2081970 RepID=A0A328U4L1_9BACL|nr:hypothetical protein [Paenibacillus montanisoli]RAP74806.1 hypothetical protein DL346_22475 [Paenibacillus montanisoli]
MPLVAKQRITSQTSNVVFAATEAAAVTAALTGVGGSPVVAVSNPFPFWPTIQKYANDNNPTFGAAANPAYIWSETPADPGESFGFAAISNSIPTLFTDNQYVITVTVFSDNAHTLRISAYDDEGLIPATNLNIFLNDGDTTSFNPSENGISPPYGWQNVRSYTINTIVSVGIFDNVRFIISFTGVNYDSNGPENPAGLAFIADIYQMVTST